MSTENQNRKEIFIDEIKYIVRKAHFCPITNKQKWELCSQISENYGVQIECHCYLDKEDNINKAIERMLGKEYINKE